ALEASWTSVTAAAAEPVRPVEPESPETATGLDTAEDDAGPVLPVFVADDCAVEAPEFPDVAVGSREARTAPPSPPSATALAMESPPVTLPTRRSLLLALPPMIDRKSTRLNSSHVAI